MVSVIVLTWNHLDYTKKAVSSILPILKPTDEIIFVDNHSSDDTQDYLSSLDLHCGKALRMPMALCGCGAAYNIGLREARGDYIFFYDNDLEIVMPDTLDHMVEVFQNNKDAGIVCPCMNNIIGSIRSCESMNKLPGDIQQISTGHKKWWPECPSAAWLLKREVLEKVGLWDEQFDPYGMNDYDYARRVILAGYKILCDRNIFVLHHGSITSKAYVNAKMLDVARTKFFRKWAPNAVYPKGGIPRVEGLNRHET